MSEPTPEPARRVGEVSPSGEFVWVRRRSWRYALTWILFTLESCVVVFVVVAGVTCTLAWYRGDSIDPRCALRRPGYLEVNSTRAGAKHVSCEYQPEEIAQMENLIKPESSPPTPAHRPLLATHN